MYLPVVKSITFCTLDQNCDFPEFYPKNFSRLIREIPRQKTRYVISFWDFTTKRKYNKGFDTKKELLLFCKALFYPKDHLLTVFALFGSCENYQILAKRAQQ